MQRLCVIWQGGHFYMTIMIDGASKEAVQNASVQIANLHFFSSEKQTF